LEILQDIPPDFVKFLVVGLLSLLIGLEQRRHNITVNFEKLFGTDRTFTLIGLLGYILYIISPKDMLPFIAGGGAITLLLAIFYYQKIEQEKMFGFTSIVTALITYCLAPLIYTQPPWLILLIVVCVLVLTEIKENLFEFTQKFDNNEFITLAKFLILAGVILPLLPDNPISAAVNISPFRFGLAIVVVSGISYFSYLLRKFVFPNAGILLTGILGGLYSSTATTFILARKSKEQPEVKGYISGIVLATTMMYLRIFLLAVFFNMDVAMGLLPYFAIFVALSAGLSFMFWKFDKSEKDVAGPVIDKEQNNPLELKTATVFAFLFILFSVVTTYVFKHYGASGINGLALIVGVTDIDPFILNLFQHNGNITTAAIIFAVVTAISSNNLLKLIYSLVLCGKTIRKPLIISFLSLIVVAIALEFIF